eukprot:TRINITY_DN4660_c1_g1_i3.p1 TRINITY_DN4660_c1_g1~~TRINITY_DN4660_c1_g1_i3.p1  ORF type:complete len:206 (-),score=-14.29 TRINITY_DN4660_c1_g1_i3:183-800(-)
MITRTISQIRTATLGPQNLVRSWRVPFQFGLQLFVQIKEGKFYQKIHFHSIKVSSNITQLVSYFYETMCFQEHIRFAKNGFEYRFKCVLFFEIFLLDEFYVHAYKMKTSKLFRGDRLFSFSRQKRKKENYCQIFSPVPQQPRIKEVLLYQLRVQNDQNYLTFKLQFYLLTCYKFWLRFQRTQFLKIKYYQIWVAMVTLILTIIVT